MLTDTGPSGPGVAPHIFMEARDKDVGTSECPMVP